MTIHVGLSSTFNSFLLFSVFDATTVFTESKKTLFFREQFWLSITLTHVLYKGDDLFFTHVDSTRCNRVLPLPQLPANKQSINKKIFPRGRPYTCS